MVKLGAWAIVSRGGVPWRCADVLVRIRVPQSVPAYHPPRLAPHLDDKPEGVPLFCRLKQHMTMHAAPGRDVLHGAGIASQDCERIAARQGLDAILGADHGQRAEQARGVEVEAPQSRPGASLPLCAGFASGPATPTSDGTTAAGRSAPFGVCSVRGAHVPMCQRGSTSHGASGATRSCSMTPSVWHASTRTSGASRPCE